MSQSKIVQNDGGVQIGILVLTGSISILRLIGMHRVQIVHAQIIHANGSHDDDLGRIFGVMLKRQETRGGGVGVPNGLNRQPG